MKPKDPAATDPTIANRFLAHQLSDAERVVLEAQLMVDADAVRELEATARLKIGLHRLRETGELDKLLAAPVPRRNNYRLAVVASACIASVLLIWQAVTGPEPVLVRTVHELSQRAPTIQASAETYRFMRTRDTTGITIVELPVTRQAIRLRVLPNAAVGPYRVSLAKLGEQGASKTISTITLASADPDNFITVYVDSGLLQSARYLLAVSSTTDAESEEQFMLEVRSPPSSTAP